MRGEIAKLCRFCFLKFESVRVTSPRVRGEVEAEGFG
jgi:hypothetical protein